MDTILSKCYEDANNLCYLLQFLLSLYDMNLLLSYNTSYPHHPPKKERKSVSDKWSPTSQIL